MSKLYPLPPTCVKKHPPLNVLDGNESKDSEPHIKCESQVANELCKGKGGRTTISPPSKVKSNKSKTNQILASGIDSLNLSIYIEWENESFFKYLETMKDLAIHDDKDTAIEIKSETETLWKAMIKPHGRGGYEWIILGSEFSLLVGNWLDPQTKPSILAEIRSEALWRIGPMNMVDLIETIISESGGKIVSTKISRVDLCVDFTFPENRWDMYLIEHSVTRAKYCSLHLDNMKLTGISIGKGKLSARLYDKPKEIVQKSKKYWMYQVWDIDKVPENIKIIRVEFQLRREIIKELGLDLVDSLKENLDGLWAYCTQQWLKFQTRQGKHHTQRKTFRWWKIVQNGFMNFQNPTPFIRCESLSLNKDRLLAHAVGFLSSVRAINLEEAEVNHETSAKELIMTLRNHLENREEIDPRINKDIHNKRAKYHRIKDKILEISIKRHELGQPSNLPIGDIMREMKNE